MILNFEAMFICKQELLPMIMDTILAPSGMKRPILGHDAEYSLVVFLQ